MNTITSSQPNTATSCPLCPSMDIHRIHETLPDARRGGFPFTLLSTMYLAGLILLTNDEALWPVPLNRLQALQLADRLQRQVILPVQSESKQSA
jgi:hypothetical protein